LSKELRDATEASLESFNALMLYTDTTQRLAVQAMNYDLQIDLDYRQSHANNFANLVSQLPEVQQVSYDRCSHEQYIPPRTVVTDPAYQALQELTNFEFENLPSPVEGGTYAFVLKVCAVGSAEFAHYAAQLGLDLQQYSDPSAPLGILLNHNTLRQGGKLYDFDLLSLKPGDTLTATRMSGWPPSTRERSKSQPDVDSGRCCPRDPAGLYGDGSGSGTDRLGRRLR
jgi:hypothetical protein